jgi:hypothetical protein
VVDSDEPRETAMRVDGMADIEGCTRYLLDYGSRPVGVNGEEGEADIRAAVALELRVELFAVPGAAPSP